MDVQFDHTCVLTEQRALRCWGANKYGELGYGDTKARGAAEAGDVPLPGPVESFTLAPGLTCVVVGGAVYCWGAAARERSHIVGDDEPVVPAALVPFAKRVVAIAAGHYYQCLLDESKSVTCWGDRSRSQLGGPAHPSEHSTIISSPLDIDAVPLGFAAEALTVGTEHACALSSAGGVRCWGFADDGKLGYLDDTTTIAKHGDLPLPGKTLQISAGSYGTTALRADGGLSTWGDWSQTREPHPAASLFEGCHTDKRFIQVSRGRTTSCGVVEGGGVRCWENETQDEENLGQGKEPERSRWHSCVGNRLEEVDIKLPGAARQVAVNKFKNDMCAVLVDGRLYCWGENSPEKILGYDRTDAIGDDEDPEDVGPVPLAP